MGHDLGHTPFGHAGEYILNEICEDGFAHYKQSVRVVEILEKKGQGLNLTKEVRDGMLNHRTSGNPATMEGKIVRSFTVSPSTSAYSLGISRSVMIFPRIASSIS